MEAPEVEVEPRLPSWFVGAFGRFTYTSTSSFAWSACIRCVGFWKIRSAGAQSPPVAAEHKTDEGKTEKETRTNITYVLVRET